MVETYIDPAKYFSKVVCDFRTVVEQPTMRGLTWENQIVNFEYENPDGKLYVIHGYKDRIEYDHYMSFYNIMGTFTDQRYAEVWRDRVQTFIQAYEQYLKGKT